MAELLMNEPLNGEYAFNPKANRPQNKRNGRLFNWTAERNPIEGQITDKGQLKEMFSKYPLIPYAGTSYNSGHRLLYFLLSMVDLSTTHGACIVSQKKFAFGGKLGLCKNSDSVFSFEEDIESIEEKKAFAKFIKRIKMNSFDIKTFSENLFISYKATGNAYFSLTMRESLGEKSVTLTYHRPETALYMYPDKVGGDYYIAVSNDFTKLDDTPPSLYPVYPNMHTRKNGDIVTMFHVKDTTDIYGRPDSMSSFLYQYREFQDANYLILDCDNGFTGKVLIEIEDGDSELDEVDDPDSLENVIDKFERNYTNKGDDPLSIMFLTRPAGASQAFVHEFSPNTNEKFFNISSEINERKILISHSWSARLLGESKAAGLSTNLFTDELESKLPLLEGYQTLIESYVNAALDKIIDFYGAEEFRDYSIKFRTPFNVIKDATQDESKGREERAGVNMNRNRTTIA